MKNHKIRSILIAATYCFLSSMQAGLAQEAKLDSMIRALSAMEEDTHKMYLLINIGVTYLNQSAYALANSYFEQSLVISEKKNHEKGRGLYYSDSGLVDYHLGRYDKALAKFDISLKIFKAIYDRKGIANTYSNIGMVYSKQGEFAEAIENYHSALSYRDGSDRRGKSAAYNNLGIVYYQSGDYPKALEYYLLSLEIDEELGDKMDIAFSNNNVGMVYEYLGKYDEAIRYFTLANTLCQEVGHQECVAGTNINIANLYKIQGKTEAAIEKFHQCLITFEEIGNRYEIASASGNLGDLYYRIGEFDKAYTYHSTALNIYEELGNDPGIIVALSDLGMDYREQHQYEDALHSFETSTQLAKKTGLKFNLQDSYYEWSVLDSMMGNTGDALAHYKLYALYKDSLQDEKNLEMLAEIQNKYDFEKKDKEIQALEKEHQINTLELKVQRETVARIRTEKERLHTENLYHVQQIELLDKDKKLQDLSLQKNEADILAQRAEAMRKEDLLTLLNQQNEIKDLRLKRQSQFQMYMFAGFLLLGFLAILAYSHYQTRQKLKFQLLRNKIASDLHDDVGSTLSSISIFSQMARQQSRDINPLLDSIGESSRKMLDAMADIVWTINPENDQFEKIILRMRSFAYELLGAKNIEFEFDAEDDIVALKLPMEVRKNLYLIFKEATNNLVKYAEADKASFTIREEKNTLSMLIRDNGKGFDITRSTEGNGIKNMRKRAEEIGGRLYIDSEPGHGTTIQLRIAV
jgi:two-component system sensor histidine kinase UhpB